MFRNNNDNKALTNAAILAAIESGDIEKLFLVTEPDDVKVKDIVELTMIPRKKAQHEQEGNNSQTPFITAAARGYYGVVHYLIWLAKRYEQVIDLDALDANNKNALMYAAIGGYEKVVDLLLKNGCDPRIAYQDSQPDSVPVSIHMLAQNAGHVVVAEKLKTTADAKNKVATALYKNHLFRNKPASAKIAAEPRKKKRRVSSKKRK